MPLNDDWVYATDVMNSVKNSKLSFLGIESAWGIPQVYVASLFPPENNFHLTLRFFGILSNIGTIVSLYFLVTRVSKNKTTTLLLLLAVVFFPPFFLVGMSFMTDSFFLFLVTLTALLFDSAFEEKSEKKLLMGFVICLISILQRQFAALFFIPISLAAVVLYKRNSRLSVITAIGAVVILLTYFSAKHWWLNNTRISFEPSFITRDSFSLSYIFHHIFILLFYTGLIASPVSFAINYFGNKSTVAWCKVSFPKWIFLISIVFFAVKWVDVSINAPFNGNLFSAFGIFDENMVLQGSRPVIYPDYFRYFLTLFGCVFFIPLMIWQPEKHKLETILSFFYELRFGAVTIIFGGFYLCLVILRGIFYDRYYLPFLPALLVLSAMFINQFKLKKNPLLSFATLGLIAIFTTTLCMDYFKWNEAKWTLAEGLKNQNVSVNDIDGGYEWNGWNGKILNAHPYFAASTAKYFVSFSNENNFSVIKTVDWYSIWPPHQRKMYLLELPHKKLRM